MGDEVRGGVVQRMNSHGDTDSGREAIHGPAEIRSFFEPGFVKTRTFSMSFNGLLLSLPFTVIAETRLPTMRTLEC